VTHAIYLAASSFRLGALPGLPQTADSEPLCCTEPMTSAAILHRDSRTPVGPCSSWDESGLQKGLRLVNNGHAEKLKVGLTSLRTHAPLYTAVDETHICLRRCPTKSWKNIIRALLWAQTSQCLVCRPCCTHSMVTQMRSVPVNHSTELRAFHLPARHDRYRHAGLHKNIVISAGSMLQNRTMLWYPCTVPL
jgi:hypothetical protein